MNRQRGQLFDRLKRKVHGYWDQKILDILKKILFGYTGEITFQHNNQILIMEAGRISK